MLDGAGACWRCSCRPPEAAAAAGGIGWTRAPGWGGRRAGLQRDHLALSPGALSGRCKFRSCSCDLQPPAPCEQRGLLISRALDEAACNTNEASAAAARGPETVGPAEYAGPPEARPPSSATRSSTLACTCSTSRAPAPQPERYLGRRRRLPASCRCCPTRLPLQLHRHPASQPSDSVRPVTAAPRVSWPPPAPPQRPRCSPAGRAQPARHR